MKTIYNIKSIIVLMLCITVISCSKDDGGAPSPQPDPDPTITSITLNKTEVTLNVEDTDQLSVTTNVNGKPITWTSDTSDIVSIDASGTITALRGGGATITAKVENAQATCAVTVNPDVYVIGSRSTKGTVWKNGEIINENLGSVSDVFVNENGVYVLREKKVFLNDKQIFDLTNRDRTLTSLYVDGQDVYVSGYEPSGSNIVSKVWRNGEEKILSASGLSEANAVVVYNGDMYVAGTYKESGFKVNKVMLWKNGIATEITDGSRSISSKVTSLFVDGEDVYIGGSAFNGGLKATIWKNGVETNLGGKEIKALFVKDGDVYATGFETTGVNQNTRALLWKNGVKSNLTDGANAREYGNDIMVFNDDVYVAVSRYDESVANKTSMLLFKNGEATVLGNGNHFNDVIKLPNRLFAY